MLRVMKGKYHAHHRHIGAFFLNKKMLPVLCHPSYLKVSSRLRSEVVSLKRELEEAHSMWEARLEGLKATLQATEQHSHALERELAMRPTVQQV